MVLRQGTLSSLFSRVPFSPPPTIPACSAWERCGIPTILSPAAPTVSAATSSSDCSPSRHARVPPSRGGRTRRGNDRFRNQRRRGGGSGSRFVTASETESNAERHSLRTDDARGGRSVFRGRMERPFRRCERALRCAEKCKDPATIVPVFPSGSVTEGERNET